MFSEEIEVIKTAFSNYFADGKYFTIFLMALLILIIEEKKKENRDFLLYYPVLLLVVILNPIFCAIILKVVSQNIYYRFFWTLPLGIIIAYVGTILISKLDKKVTKAIVGMVFIGMIAYSGTFVYSNQTFEKVNNWYKLPDEYIQVIQILSEAPLSPKKAVTSIDMIGYIRQIDANIHLAYERRPYGDYDQYEIVRYYNSGDVENLTKLCKQKRTNIIVYDNSIQLTISPTYFGFELYAQTEHYDIYIQRKRG